MDFWLKRKPVLSRSSGSSYQSANAVDGSFREREVSAKPIRNCLQTILLESIYTYVTTKHFLSAFGIDTVRDVPDVEMLEDAGLLNRQVALLGDDSDDA